MPLLPRPPAAHLAEARGAPRAGRLRRPRLPRVPRAHSGRGEGVTDGQAVRGAAGQRAVWVWPDGGGA